VPLIRKEKYFQDYAAYCPLYGSFEK
jgi:hypothetical protein